MSTAEVTVATILVAVSLGVAGVFGWRQLRQHRHFKNAAPSPEQQFMLRVARRRLIISVMLALIGIGIATLYLSGLEQSVNTIAELKESHPDRALQTARLYSWTWLAILILLFGIVVTVGIDLYDVRRHWRQSLQQIRDERRDMMDVQLAKLRDEHREAQLDPERN